MSESTEPAKGSARRWRFSPSLAAWPAWLILLFAIPIVFIVVISFWRMDGQVLNPDFTLDNYRFAFEPSQLEVLVRSILTGLLVAGIGVLLAYPFAYFVVFRINSPGATVNLLLIVALPFLVGPLIRGIAWTGLLGVQGVINTALDTIGVIGEPMQWLLFSRFALVVTLVYNTYAFIIFALVLTLETIDRSAVTAARDLGAGAWRTFFHVILPLSIPGLVVGGVLAFVPAVGASLEPDLVGGPSGRMIANVITDQFFLASNWPAGAALALLFAVTVLIVAGIYSAILARFYRPKKVDA